MSGKASALRYVAATRVIGPAGEVAPVELRGARNETIGNLDGLLIDPVERRLRFFVVQSSGLLRSRRYLLPSDCSAQVDAGGRALRVAVERSDLARCQEYRSSSVPTYSDDDVVDAMFGQRIA